MRVEELNFIFPESQIATEPKYPPRVMWVGNEGEPRESNLAELLQSIPSGDVLVINSTQVLKRRVFLPLPAIESKQKSNLPNSMIKLSDDELEILFLKAFDNKEWEVLFPSRTYPIGTEFILPEGIRMTLVQKGRPQIVSLSESLPESYFVKHGELPLPPYIQKARHRRHTEIDDSQWYQTAWNKDPGSLAAPTASLHFREQDLQVLRSRGVRIVSLILHVGLGTFLPVIVDNLDDHLMHEEFVEIPAETWQVILEAKSQKHNIWCLGTTVTRAVESAAAGLLSSRAGGFSGMSRLLIQPGFAWQITDRLLTNFHQPKSTLLALVAAFAGLSRVQNCYAWAIDRGYRLFSYGDLSVWEHPREL